MSNEEIVEQIQNGIDITKNQERLWIKNRKFVLMIIKKYCGFTEELEDLEQQGFLGLITGAMKYQRNKGVKFLTYSAYWIKQSIFRYYESCCIRIPEYMKINIRKYERYRQEYRNQNGNFPSDEESCKELRISPYLLRSLEKTIYNLHCISLDTPATEDDTRTILDMLESDMEIEETVTYSVYRKELHTELEQAMKLLEKETREIIYSIYYQGNSMESTATILHCSRQNIYNRIGKGFYKILHSPYRARLESFMWEGFQYNEKVYYNYAELDNIENEFII